MKPSLFRRGAAALLLAMLGAACDPHSTALRQEADMTALSPRLQALFETTRTVCFGRFLIDVPVHTQLVWGEVDVPLGLWVEPGAGHELAQRVAEVEEHLKSEDRYPLSKGLKLYFETLDGAVPGLRHVVSQQDFDSTGLLRINSFFALGEDLVGLNALPLANDKRGTLDELDDMARRLRPRAEDEVPSEPGTCVERAFLAEAPGTRAEDVNEHVQVGFRLAEFPDVHLSIQLRPHTDMRWTLEEQLRRTEDDARKAGRPAPFGHLKVFRRGAREIHDWKGGFELLTRTPEGEQSRSYQDFWMKFTGVHGDPLHPHADIKLQTGVDDNGAGAVRPSLSDDEALALWYRLTGSIRVRPTGAAAKVGAAAPGVPLGTLAVTGRRCPHAGWWECADDLALVPPSGRWLHEGEPMPYARVWEPASVWPLWRGPRRQAWATAMWRLAAYEAPKPPPQ